MRKLYKVTAGFFLAIIVILGVSAAGIYTSAEAGVSTSVTQQNTVVEDGESGQVSVENPGVIEQFGPPGLIITTVLSGILLIVRSINEGKKIDVTTYKERAADAETRSDAEIGKVHQKLQELEDKLDAVIADRDQYRNTLEAKKTEWTDQFLEQGRRHQIELESLHAALVSEIHIRHKLERIMAENNIVPPDTPPPYTQKMRNEASSSDEREANRVTVITSEVPIVLPE